MPDVSATGGGSAASGDAVRAALASIAGEKGVRVLFAAESGSRAWGFASPDSDYDVRFLYVPAWESYDSVFPGADSLTANLPGDLDMAGWELRKALQLFAKGNGPLYEWLGSPIVYRELPGFADELRALLPAVFHPPVVLFHYLGLARRTLEAHLGATPWRRRSGAWRPWARISRSGAGIGASPCESSTPSCSAGQARNPTPSKGRSASRIGRFSTSNGASGNVFDSQRKFNGSLTLAPHGSTLPGDPRFSALQGV